MFRRFGSHVTIVQSSGQLLWGEDADVASGVAAILKQDGIRMLLSTKATGVIKEGAKIRVTVRMEMDNETRVLDGSHLLVATGRVPNTDTLNVAAAGIAAEQARIQSR